MGSGSGVEMSLCGGQLVELAQAGGRGLDAGVLAALFAAHRVEYAQLAAGPAELLSDPRLVVRLRDKIYPWSVAAPMLASLLLFGRDLDPVALARLEAREGDRLRPLLLPPLPPASAPAAAATPSTSRSWGWSWFRRKPAPGLLFRKASTCWVFSAGRMEQVA